MNMIPDTQELLRTGLSNEKPYLGSFSVVEDRVRTLLSEVNDLRAKQIADGATDMQAGLKALCSDFQNTFYGKNPNFIASAWHREDQLGEALVNGAGMGGETGDAVERLAAKIISDYLAFYLPFEAEEIGDEQFQFGIEGVVEFYTHVLLGLPYEAD